MEICAVFLKYMNVLLFFLIRQKHHFSTHFQMHKLFSGFLLAVKMTKASAGRDLRVTLDAGMVQDSCGVHLTVHLTEQAIPQGPQGQSLAQGPGNLPERSWDISWNTSMGDGVTLLNSLFHCRPTLRYASQDFSIVLDNKEISSEKGINEGGNSVPSSQICF